MKWTRIAVVVLLTAALLLTSGCSSILETLDHIFVDEDERPGQSESDGDMPKFSEIEYVRPDLDAISETYEALIADLEANKLTVSEGVRRLGRCYELYDDFYTQDTVAELRYYHDVTDTFYADEYDWFYENEPEMSRLFEALCSASANCDNGETLDKRFWGGWTVDAYRGQETATLDPTYLALAKRENAVLSEYHRALSDPTVFWRGKECSYWDLQEDDSITEEEWDEIQTLYYDKYADALGEIYIRLVGVRQEIAAYLGYDSYEDYAYDLYGREYTPAQAAALTAEVREEIAPLYGELSINDRWKAMRYTVIDEEELTSALRDAAREMGGAIWQAFEDMERYELYDFTISEKKGNMSYQCYLYSYDQPFIIVKTEGWSDDILNCGHELGHFVDAWYNHNGTDSEDLAEVFSQGMEYLLLSRVSKRYREELTEYKLLDTVDTLSQQASFAAFEHEIYARPAAEWTPEAINELSLELAREYGYLVEGMEDYYAKSWFDISHFFDTPFYIISYCVSIDAAFQIYELDCSENAGLERWNKLLPRDRDGFLDTVVDQGGLEDPFAADRMQEIAALLREKLK